MMLSLQRLSGLARLNGKALHLQSYFSSTVRMMSVLPIPALADNYMYLLIDDKTRKAAAVDPVEPEKLIAEAKRRNVDLCTVLTTHHHSDHSGGNTQIKSLIPTIHVVGGDERVPSMDEKVSDGAQLKIGSLDVKCMHTPCHTRGHICYYVISNTGRSIVFTGDTLFIAGCGRFFEGDGKQMYTALIDKLGSLPDHTEVYCGHEYTVANLRFARVAEPDNKDVIEKLHWALEKRKNNEPTVPSTIAEEKLTNPFMRVEHPSVQEHTKSGPDPIKAMETLRIEKNNFS